MNTPEKDYSHRGWIAALALIAVLGAVSFIPPQSLGGVKLRRANILSDILSFEDAAAEAAEPALFDEDDFHVDMAQVARRIEAERIEADTAPRPVQTTFEWLLRQDSSGRRAVASVCLPSFRIAAYLFWLPVVGGCLWAGRNAGVCCLRKARLRRACPLPPCTSAVILSVVLPGR